MTSTAGKFIIMILCFSVQSGVIYASGRGAPYFDDGSCVVRSVIPREGTIKVPMNSDISIVYTSNRLHACMDVTVHYGEDRIVPLRLLLHDEYRSISGDGFYGDITVRTLRNFTPNTKHTIFFGGRKISSFTTSESDIYNRGRIISILPLNIFIPHLSRTNHLSREQVSTAPTKISFGLHESELPTDAKAWKAFVNIGNTIGEGIISKIHNLSRGNFSGSALNLVMSLYFPHVLYPASLYGVSFYYVIYSTIDPYGSPTHLSAIVIIPEGKNIDYSNIPIFSYQHATVLNGSAQTDTNTFETIVGALISSRGYVVVSSDGFGFGLTKNETEPYLMQIIESQEYYDLITAIRGYFRNRYHVELRAGDSLMGISQGAHTSMAMARYMLAIDPGSVKYVYVADGPYNLEKMFFSYASMVIGNDSKKDRYLHYIRSNKFFLPVFMRKYLRSIAAYNDMSADAFDYGFYDIIGLPKRSFVKEIFEGKYRNIYTGMSVDTITNKLLSLREIAPKSSVEFHLYHEKSDPIVSYQNTVDLLHELKNKGFLSVYEGDCRKNVLFSKVVVSLVKSKDHPEWMHISCVPWLIEDIMKDIPPN
ncbi:MULTISPECIES: alpha/beta hydrolase family protein [Candidatus Ichthyocystis]|uniref:Uncharacterized protein n=1 Tax=Candidatus Ichthyocystis hellenicum TaxID=1561003 RepID=A0A0S4M756_9BURK|nr:MULTISPECIES: hypothetical protein [Ichthyocystis]CUT18093.1 hypothetical protein Ark11_1288 [Candidatus Ichthyocystis hellenicum]